MSETQTPYRAPATEPKKPLRTLDKTLVGCALGCVGLGVLAVAIAIGGVMWAVKPGRQVETSSIVGSESQMVFDLKRTTSDPGVNAVLQNGLRTLERLGQEQRRDELPESMRWLSDLSDAQGSGVGAFSWFVPKQMTLVVDPSIGEEGVESVVVAVNLAAFPRFARAMLRRSRIGEPTLYRGHEIDTLSGEDSFLAFVDGSLLWSDSRPALEVAIDRIEEPEPSPAPVNAAMDPGEDERWDFSFRSFAEPEDLKFAIREALEPDEGSSSTVDLEEDGLEPSEGGEVLLEAPFTALGASPGGVDLLTVTVSVDVLTADRLLAEIEVLGAASGDAAELRQGIEELAVGWADRLAEEDLVLETRAMASDKVLLEAELSGLRTWLRHWLETAVEEG